MMTSRALKAYGNTALENEVDAASPHKLIALLYDGAIKSVERAKLHIERGEIPQKCEAISRATAILDQGLAGALDMEAGGELSQNLRALYQYMTNRLVQANLKNDVAALDEVTKLLGELSSAWSAIGPAR
jgi:flagellar protein FliS